MFTLPSLFNVPSPISSPVVTFRTSIRPPVNDSPVALVTLTVIVTFCILLFNTASMFVIVGIFVTSTGK